ncbi:hypothetical protein MSUIS_00790 [Mycoplasma suis KI3806]|uniref:Uncharacterized protein n=1 Tax=Mycoplasma suis (strain KI_3806) TaxID=708248 RepID=F0V2V0_MYCS3|nr:hypothetical protein [Mycoplasma suis]CBZ40172.1 hypothetical protein MSUIS_00790 [Mycoplasma suis KI3806]
MIGAATWAKIALVIFSLGGAAGGTYIYKNFSPNNGLSHEQEPIPRDRRSTGGHDSESSDTSSSGTSEVSASQGVQVEGTSTTPSGNTSPTNQVTQIGSEVFGTDTQRSDISEASQTEGTDNSLNGGQQQKPNSETSNDNANVSEGQTSEVSDLSQSRDPSTTSREPSSEQVSSNSEEGEPQLPTTQEGNSRRDQVAEQQLESTSAPSSQISTNDGIQTNDSTSAITNGGYSGRQVDKKTFGENGKNQNINGEYIISREEGSNNTICSKISGGEEEGAKVGEECNATVSQNLNSLENKEKIRVWLKTENKENAKEILKGLQVISSDENWFSGERKEINVNFDLVGTLICKLSENNSDSGNNGVTVSCYSKNLETSS